MSPLWLLQRSWSKRDLLAGTSGDQGELHTPSPPLSPDECYFGEKWHGQLERAKLFLLGFFLFSPIINASNLLQLNRNKSTVGVFFKLVHLVLVGHDNINDIFLIQEGKMQITPFLSDKEVLENAFVSTQCFIFHHTR